jgi:RNA polymerase sigma factor (sigma-70 family)
MKNTSSENIEIDFQLLRSSKAYRERICLQIYQYGQLRKQIHQMILQKGGKTEDAEDVFQEAIAAFFKKAMTDESLEEMDNFAGYIYGTARNIYLKEITKRKPPIYFTDTVPEHREQDNIAFSDDANAIIQWIYKLATPTCQEVLLYWANKCSMKEIAQKMHYKSEDMAKKKKYECLQKLVHFFKNNPAAADQLLSNE